MGGGYLSSLATYSFLFACRNPFPCLPTIPFVFAHLRTLWRHGRSATLLESIRCALFPSSRGRTGGPHFPEESLHQASFQGGRAVGPLSPGVVLLAVPLSIRCQPVAQPLSPRPSPTAPPPTA